MYKYKFGPQLPPLLTNRSPGPILRLVDLLELFSKLEGFRVIREEVVSLLLSRMEILKTLVLYLVTRISRILTRTLYYIRVI